MRLIKPFSRSEKTDMQLRRSRRKPALRLRSGVSQWSTFHRPQALHRSLAPPRTASRGAWPQGRAALSQLSERECRDAPDEHDESECREASRDQPEPSRSELPSQTE